MTPIARLTADQLVVVVPANSPHKTMKDLAAAMKADTSKVVWAGGSAGGADHILAGLVTKAAGGDATKLNYVPFSGGGEALAEMLGGRVTAGISGYNEFESQIKAGKLRALGISGGKRMAGVDVPTLKEQGLDVELLNWRGIVAGPGITRGAEDGARRRGQQGRASRKTGTRSSRRAAGTTPTWTPTPFAAFLKADQARVKDVLTSVGLVK